MKFRPGPEDLVPIRAALSASIAILIAWRFPSQRWYWAVLVSVILVSGTFGEGTQKGLTRFFMTALGCVTAWGLGRLFGGSFAGRVAVMLGCIFLAVYFRGASYAWFTFFISVYVVFLFSVFGAPTGQITLFRVYETFIGCGIALAASLIIPMPSARRQWEEEAAKFWRTCRDQAARSFDALLGPAERPGSPAAGAYGGPAPAAILRQLNVLAARHAFSSYETFLSPRQQRHRRQVMARVRRLAQAVLALDHVASSGLTRAAARAFGGEVTAVRDWVLSGLEAARVVEQAPGGPDRRPQNPAPAGSVAGPADALSDRVLAARRGGAAYADADDLLVLEAVGQFSIEIVRGVTEAAFGPAPADPAPTAPAGSAATAGAVAAEPL